jgi:hypothetical protein
MRRSKRNQPPGSSVATIRSNNPEDEEDAPAVRRVKRRRKRGGAVDGKKPRKRIDKRARGGGIAHRQPGGAVPQIGGFDIQAPQFRGSGPPSPPPPSSANNSATGAISPLDDLMLARALGNKGAGAISPLAAADNPELGGAPPAGGETARGGRIGHRGGGAVTRGGGVGERFRRLMESTPEPRSDVRAQIGAMLDLDHPKDAVFVARGNERAIPKNLPRGIAVVRRPEGTLLTVNGNKARFFDKKRRIDDGDLARILGYPERKRDVLVAALRGQPVTDYQAHDEHGNVVASAMTSARRAGETARAISRQIPPGGRLVQASPLDEQAHRFKRRAHGGAMTPDEAAFARMSGPERRAYHEAQRRATANGLPGGTGRAGGVTPSARGGRLPRRRT